MSLYQSRVTGLVVLAALAYGGIHRRLTRLEKERAAQQAFTRQVILSEEKERKRIAGEQCSRYLAEPNGTSSQRVRLQAVASLSPFDFSLYKVGFVNVDLLDVTA